MSDITSWEQSPAGLVRNQGLAAPELDRAREITSAERIAAKRSFDQAWGESGVLDVQRRLAEAGWTGAWINVPGPLVPAELAPLGIAAKAEQTTRATISAGRKDAEYVRVEREQLARYEAAQARLDAKLGPLARTVG